MEPYQLANIFSKNKIQKISSGIIPNSKKQSLLEKIMLWIRGNIFIPDARVLWVKPSIKYLEQYIQNNNINTIITSGPPHSLHLIGLGLQQKLNVRWIADFRDPWTTIGYHKSLKLSSLASKKHKYLEHKILNAANQIIVTSPTTKTEFQAITNQSIHTITNGFDTQIVTDYQLDNKFTLAHIGSFLSDRNPEILWQSLQELINENSDFSLDFELKLIGKTSDEVLNTIDKFGLLKNTINLGYVTHNEAINHQKSAQVLLLVEINSSETTCIIPGKLFEYLASNRPIIGIGPENADFETIIKNTNTGTFVNYNQKKELKTTIYNYYNLYKSKNLYTNPIGVDQYSRKNLTKQLAEILK